MQSDEQEIRQLVATWMAATKAGDIETVLSLMAEDVPGAGEKEEIGAACAALLTALAVKGETETELAGAAEGIGAGARRGAGRTRSSGFRPCSAAFGKRRKDVFLLQGERPLLNAGRARFLRHHLGVVEPGGGTSGLLLGRHHVRAELDEVLFGLLRLGGADCGSGIRGGHWRGTMPPRMSPSVF